MKKKILQHFQNVDPLLFAAIDDDIRKYSISTTPKQPQDYFVSLTRAVVGQQLSGKAASSIFARFQKSFPRGNITAAAIAKRSEHDLRSLGLSYAKARALLDFSEKYLQKKVSFRNIEERENEAIIEMLLQIKGVGPWTAEMFLMFSVGREDIFSPKDLGLQKGIQRIYQLDTRPSETEAAEYAEKWSPFRTYASIILWHVIDNT